MAKVLFSNSKGQQLQGVYSSAGKSDYAIVMCHGLGSSMNDPSFMIMERGLNRAGIDTLRFSYYSQRLLNPNPQYISTTDLKDDATRAYRQMKKTHRHVGFLGFSLGGLAAIMAASEAKNPWAVALLSPVATHLGEALSHLAKVDVKEWEKHGFFMDGKLKYPFSLYEDASRYNVPKAASKIKCPVVIYQGDLDRKVDPKNTDIIAKRIPNCRYEKIIGADHIFLKNLTLLQVMRGTVEFFKSQK